MIGLIATAGGLGALPGAVLTRWAARRFGVGRTIVGGWLGWAMMGLAVPLATGAPWMVVTMLCLGQGLGGLTDTVANVQQWSLRQVVTPDALQARVTASHRFLVQGAGALGALIGGFLGAKLGLRPTLWLCSLGLMLGLLPVLFSPLWRLRTCRQRQRPRLAGEFNPMTSPSLRRSDVEVDQVKAGVSP